MKTQMRVQKILMIVSLVLSALVLVFALIFLTGGLGNVYRFNEDGQDYINCDKFVSTSQSFVSTLVTLSIVMIVLAAFLFLMGCHSRRKYYITNYIVIGIFVVFALAVAIYLIAMVANVMNLYQNDIRWESGTGEIVTRFKDIYEIDPITGENKLVDTVAVQVYTNYADQAEFLPAYVLDPDQSYNFVLGIIMFVLIIVDVICIILSTVWKVLLVKGEKKLLAAGTSANDGVSEEDIVVMNDEAKEIKSAELTDEPVKEGE